MKQIVAFRNFAKAPKNSDYLPTQQSPTGLSNGGTPCSLQGTNCTVGYNVHDTRIECLTAALKRTDCSTQSKVVESKPDYVNLD